MSEKKCPLHKIFFKEKNFNHAFTILLSDEKVPQDAQAHKDELKRINQYVTDLQEKVKKECDNFSEDVKYWAEYKTGIKEFMPWLTSAESSFTEGLAKPASLAAAKNLSEKVHGFEKSCSE